MVCCEYLIIMAVEFHLQKTKHKKHNKTKRIRRIFPVLNNQTNM